MTNTELYICGAAILICLVATVFACHTKYCARKLMEQMCQMIDMAAAGNFHEETYDESMISALETKLAHYLASSKLSSQNLSQEKETIKELIADISHQTRTPIANILLYTLEPQRIYARFDHKWTAEAIYNIVDNAVKYTPDGGTVSIDILHTELFVRIGIKDSGIGIPEEETAKIFRRFYRSPQAGGTEGVGIG